MNGSRFVLHLMLAAACLPCFSGCATILSDRTYPVTVDNSGGQTYFSVRDRKNQVVHEGVTPSQVVLDAKAHPFWPAKYDVTFVGTGDAVQKREIKAGVDPWVAGNIIAGGPIGAAVEGVSGAMFKLPKRVTGDIPAQYAITDMNQGAQIAANHVKTIGTNPATVGEVVEQVGFQRHDFQGQPETATLER